MTNAYERLEWENDDVYDPSEEDSYCLVTIYAGFYVLEEDGGFSRLKEMSYMLYDYWEEVEYASQNLADEIGATIITLNMPDVETRQFNLVDGEWVRTR